MEDFGTTATTDTQSISPETHTEESPAVTKIKEAMAAALNAVMEQSKLAEQVQALVAEVGTIRDELQSLRVKNAELDAVLADVRRQRDVAEYDLSQTKTELGNVKHMYERCVNDLDNAHTRASSLQNRLDESQDNLRFACGRADKAEAEATALREKLAQIEAIMGGKPSSGSLTPQVEADKPVADQPSQAQGW